jgi:hypothetical protein
VLVRGVRLEGEGEKYFDEHPEVGVLCPCRDTLLDVSTRYLWVQGFSGSMVQWFRGGLNDQVWTEDERNPVDCKIKTKTKLRSTTDTKVILIVEDPQLIVNTRTQMSHREKVLEGNGTMTSRSH